MQTFFVYNPQTGATMERADSQSEAQVKLAKLVLRCKRIGVSLRAALASGPVSGAVSLRRDDKSGEYVPVAPYARA